jgi:phospholipase C
MFQENRSFDHYFGKLNDYRAMQGLPPDVDGIPPQGFTQPNYEGTGTVPSFKMTTACIVNPSPSWNESHVDYNLKNPASSTATMDGFVHSAAGDSRANNQIDQEGYRAMGYHDWNELNYYYFMATAFATSDRWFSPVPARSPPNRYYGFAATSEGRIDGSTTQLKAKTIFQALDEAGITWKIYVADDGVHHSPKYATTYDWIIAHKDHMVGMTQYYKDLESGNFPQVALVESAIGLDEHPGEGNNLFGQQYTAKIINAFMNSPVYKDGVFILTYDEFGGLYDHVVPLSVPNPDGIKPILDAENHIPGDFDRTGFRLPLIVVSPFVKPHYVSHVQTDFTAILKLIETRFGLPNLTLRDAGASDMTDFFDFSTPTGPLATAPKPPDPVPTNTLPCDGNQLGYPPTTPPPTQ